MLLKFYGPLLTRVLLCHRYDHCWADICIGILEKYIFIMWLTAKYPIKIRPLHWFKTGQSYCTKSCLRTLLIVYA
jgi:hypothetical protein